MQKNFIEANRHYHSIALYHWECSVYGTQLDECMDKMTMLFPTILTNPFDREKYYKILDEYKRLKIVYEEYMQKIIKAKSKIEKIAISLKPKNII